jgi:hypothetical protein
MPDRRSVPPSNPSAPADAPAKRPLSPAAERALQEAAARRAERDKGAERSKDQHGRGGLDPVRYGDWEVQGRATDF